MEPTWVGEASGPLLLLPECLLPEWSGIDVPEYRAVTAEFRWNAEEPRACDYDRACDVEAAAGVIAVGYGEGLVLSEGLLPTTWIPRPWGGLLARWDYAESETACDRALARMTPNLDWAAIGTLSVVGSPSVLFNSAEPGLDIVMARLTVGLAEGRYAVRCARYEPDARTAFRIIELRRDTI